MPRTYSLGELQQRQRDQARLARPAILAGSSPAEPEDLGALDTARDIIAAPLRGIEGAVQDIYGLADTLAFDALPDYEERLLGESRTRVGGLIEGVSNFAVGFAAAGFVPLGWTAKLGRLSGVARAAARGAVADFAVFDGHEERLSNLVQSFPVLQNPITEFLAADEGDAELEGRFKNALEGLGIGTLTDALIGSVKALRAGRKARAAGKTAEEVEAAMDKVAPPEEIEAAYHRAGAFGETADEALPSAEKPIGDPSRPEAAEAVLPPAEPLPAAATGTARSAELLQTMGLSADQARELMEGVERRRAPVAVGPTQLEGLPELDPRVNPRRLTEAERVAQGMQKTDLNLSQYTGPGGGLQLLRVMEQVLEPLKGLGDASKRTLGQQEEAGLKELADMVGEQNPHRLMIALQKDVQELPALNRRVLAYKTALQAYGDHVYKAADKAFKVDGTEKDILEAVDGLRTLAEMELGVKSLLGEQGRGLGANRIPTRFKTDLFDRAAIDEALHEVGGRKRALDMLEKYRTLWNSTDDSVARTAKVVDLAKGFSGRRAMGMLNEYWYNSLLGRPTTAVVNAASNGLMAVYRPLELIAGGAITGKAPVIADGVRELQALVSSAGESWRATAAALRGGGQVLDPKALISDLHDITKGAIGPEGFGVAADTVHGQALTWLGRLVRMPSTVLTATDQFFQQLNYRAVARAQLTKEALAQGVPVDQVGGVVTAELDKLIYRGQAYGTAQLYAKGVDEAARNGLRAKTAVDDYAREYVRKALETPEHARLSSLGQIAQRRAQEATFSAPLQPGTLGYRYQEMVLNHPLLRLVTPFVRTPLNILGAAADRTVRGTAGLAHVLAARKFPGLAQSLENSRNIMVKDMLSGDPRRKADALGRWTLGMSTTAAILTFAATEAEDGMPLITGFGPSDRETRQLLEASGWQQYSIRVGDRYVSYGRLDPFATILGTAADMVNYVKFAAAEDQGLVEDVTYGFAVSMAQNFTNKSYLAGLANFFEMMHDPQRSFGRWANTLAGSFVPGQAAAATAAVDPNFRDVRSMLDAMKARLPGLSDNLPPMRNVLGEPVRRAKSLGSDTSSVANAFVPILYREVSDDVILKEFTKLGHGFTPPKRQRGGLDLSTVVNDKGRNVFDRWLELHGSVTLGARGNLRKALRKLIESPAYRKIPAASTDAIQSPRIGMVQAVIDDYRAEAWRQVLREFPALGEAEKQRVASKAALRRGQETRPQLLQALQPRQ